MITRISIVALALFASASIQSALAEGDVIEGVRDQIELNRIVRQQRIERDLDRSYYARLRIEQERERELRLRELRRRELRERRHRDWDD